MAESTYTFTKDYGEMASDGTGYKLLFRIGETVSWETARQLGLVEGEPPKKVAPKSAEIAAKAEK